MYLLYCLRKKADTTKKIEPGYSHKTVSAVQMDFNKIQRGFNISRYAITEYKFAIMLLVQTPSDYGPVFSNVQLGRENFLMIWIIYCWQKVQFLRSDLVAC